MTQPPVHAISAYYIYENSEDKIKSINFLKRIFPKLMNFHRYLLTYRDQEESGLVTIFHPWESGEDDSPIWDEPLSRIIISNGDLPNFKRLDIIAVNGASITIPSDDEYNKFIYLIEIMKKYNYDEKIMYVKMPFKIKDIVFSSILYVANKYLLNIAHTLEQNSEIDDDPNDYITSKKEIAEWITRTERNYYRYFLPPHHLNVGKNELSLLQDFDLVKNDWISTKTISSLIPIFTGLLSSNEANTIVKWIKHAYHCSPGKYCHEPTLPSVDLKVDYFKPLTYWRGPVWINMNWMFWLGLLNYGYKKEAEIIQHGVFELASRHGIREYYDPYDGKGLGGKDFSWTAALVIDMIHHSKENNVRIN